jgi:hypothetical protein
MLKIQAISTEAIPQTQDVTLEVQTEDGQQVVYQLPKSLAIHLVNQLFVSLDVQGQYVLGEADLH